MTPYTLTWNSGAGTYDIAGGQSEVRIVSEEEEPKKPEQPPEVKVNQIIEGHQYTIDGRWVKGYTDGTQESHQIVIGPNDEKYHVDMWGSPQRYVSYDEMHTWEPWPHDIPRTVVPPSGGSENENQN